MSTVATLLRLARMRRTAGAGRLEALTWAGGLLWRNHRTTERRRSVEHRSEVERAARQRL